MSFWGKLGHVFVGAERIAAPIAQTVFPQFAPIINLANQAVIAAENNGGSGPVKKLDALNQIEKQLPAFFQLFGTGLGLAGDPEFRAGVQDLLDALVHFHNASGHFDHAGQPATKPIKP